MILPCIDVPKAKIANVANKLVTNFGIFEKTFSILSAYFSVHRTPSVIGSQYAFFLTNDSFLPKDSFPMLKKKTENERTFFDCQIFLRQKICEQIKLNEIQNIKYDLEHPYLRLIATFFYLTFFFVRKVFFSYIISVLCMCTEKLELVHKNPNQKKV